MKTILRDVSITVDGVDLSDHSNQVEISSTKDLVELTSFGDAYKTNDQGLGDATMAVTLFQDYDAGSVDATLWPIHDGNQECEVVIKPTSDPVSVTNPSYTMTAIIPEFTPLSGAPGEASMTPVTFQNRGQAGIVRAIA